MGKNNQKNKVTPEPLLINKKIFNFLYKYGQGLPKKRTPIILLFESINTHEFNPEMAAIEPDKTAPTNCIIFAIQHINENFFQPLGTVFYPSDISSWKFKEVLHMYIRDLKKCNLTVICSISSMSNKFYKSMSEVGEDILKGDVCGEWMYATPDSGFVVHLLDPGALLRGFRMLFLYKNIFYTVKNAKYFADVEEIRCAFIRHGYPDGCADYIYPQFNTNVEATRLFSETLYAFLIVNDCRGHLFTTPNRDTRTLIWFFDSLFDTFNGDKCKEENEYDMNPKELRRNPSSNSACWEFWIDSLEILPSIHTVNYKHREKENLTEEQIKTLFWLGSNIRKEIFKYFDDIPEHEMLDKITCDNVHLKSIADIDNSDDEEFMMQSQVCDIENEINESQLENQPIEQIAANVSIESRKSPSLIEQDKVITTNPLQSTNGTCGQAKKSKKSKKSKKKQNKENAGTKENSEKSSVCSDYIAKEARNSLLRCSKEKGNNLNLKTNDIKNNLEKATTNENCNEDSGLDVEITFSKNDDTLHNDKSPLKVINVIDNKENIDNNHKHVQHSSCLKNRSQKSCECNNKSCLKNIKVNCSIEQKRSFEEKNSEINKNVTASPENMSFLSDHNYPIYDDKVLMSEVKNRQKGKNEKYSIGLVEKLENVEIIDGSNKITYGNKDRKGDIICNAYIMNINDMDANQANLIDNKILTVDEANTILRNIKACQVKGSNKNSTNKKLQKNKHHKQPLKDTSIHTKHLEDMVEQLQLKSTIKEEDKNSTNITASEASNFLNEDTKNTINKFLEITSNLHKKAGKQTANEDKECSEYQKTADGEDNSKLFNSNTISINRNEVQNLRKNIEVMTNTIISSKQFISDSDIKDIKTCHAFQNEQSNSPQTNDQIHLKQFQNIDQEQKTSLLIQDFNITSTSTDEGIDTSNSILQDTISSTEICLDNQDSIQRKANLEQLMCKLLEEHLLLKTDSITGTIQKHLAIKYGEGATLKRAVVQDLIKQAVRETVEEVKEKDQIGSTFSAEDDKTVFSEQVHKIRNSEEYGKCFILANGKLNNYLVDKRGKLTDTQQSHIKKVDTSSRNTKNSSHNRACGLPKKVQIEKIRADHIRKMLKVIDHVEERYGKLDGGKIEHKLEVPYVVGGWYCTVKGMMAIVKHLEEEYNFPYVRTKSFSLDSLNKFLYLVKTNVNKVQDIDITGDIEINLIDKNMAKLAFEKESSVIMYLDNERFFE